MAYDLLSGKLDGRSWSRGDWSTAYTAQEIGRKVPWVPIGIGAAVVGALILLPSTTKKTKPEYHRRRWTEPTLTIPRESNKDLVTHDTAGFYGRKL